MFDSVKCVMYLLCVLAVLMCCRPSGAAPQLFQKAFCECYTSCLVEQT